MNIGKRLIIVVVFVGIALGVNASPIGSWVDRVRPAVVQLDMIRYGVVETGGNGVILCHNDKRVGVTAWHVATDRYYRPIQKMTLSQYGSPRIAVEVIYQDQDVDIALFEVPDSIRACLPLAAKLPQIAERVIFVGALAAIAYVGTSDTVIWSDFHWRYGEVTSCCRDYNDLVSGVIGYRWNSIMHANIDTATGTSGSPVLNMNLEVVGIVVGGFSANDSLLIHRNDIAAVLKRAGF